MLLRQVDGVTYSVLTLLCWVLFVLVGAMIAVAWSRFILLGERQAQAWYFDIDRRILIYAGYNVLLAVCITVIYIPVLIVALLTSARLWILAALLVCTVIALRIAARLGLILPAKALASRNVTLNSVWAMTAPHGWTLLAGRLLATLAMVPLYLLAALAGIALQASGLGPTSGVHQLIGIVSGIAGGAVHMAFLSLAFRHIYGLSPHLPQARV